MSSPGPPPPADAAVVALLAQLRDALQRGDPAAVDTLAMRVLALQPDHEQTLAYLANRARQQGDLRQARVWIEDGLRRLPRSALLRFNLGAVLEAEGRGREALATLQALAESEPDFLLARFWLAALQLSLGEDEAGLRSSLLALDEAERSGFLQRVAAMPEEMRQRVDATIAAVQRGRDAVLAEVLQPIQARYGGEALRRVGPAFDRYLGKVRISPTHALQQPSFLFVPGLPDQAWFEREDFPLLGAIENQTAAIREELLAVLADEDGLLPYVDMPDHAPAAPVWRELNRSPRWSGYHLFRHGERIEAHCRRCPRTTAALDALPLLRIPGHGPEALFSVLRPNTHIPPHTGVINGRLTVHLPLIVPEQCGALAAGGQARTWQEGHCLVFDDSFVHEAWNASAHTRVVLIFDLWNPHLGEAEREALTAGITALGAFSRRHGGADPMQDG